MKVTVTIEKSPTHIARETLLGQNLEAAGDNIRGLTSDRLSNPKFLGPAHPMTGIAPGWLPAGNNNMGTWRCELTSGMSLSGNEAQFIHNFMAETRSGILQKNLSIRAGEKMELEVWAKAWHHPVTLYLQIGSLNPRKSGYSAVTFCVDAAYWKPYRATLVSPSDDEETVLLCLVEGEGMLWIDQIHLRPEGEGMLCRDLFDRVQTLQIPVLRFPGGCISTNYHWKHGTGPVHLRPELPDPVFKQQTPYDFGTDEYLELCLAQGICPHITVNVGSGTPSEAEEWAAYCANWFLKHNAPLPQMYFQIGNEQYGAWESSHMTADMYVRALREFVPPLKKVYPNARIVALGEEKSQGLRPDQQTFWRKSILEQASDLVDILAINRYKGQWYDEVMDKQINAVESVQKIQNDLETLICDCRATGRDIKVALTEWNYWLYAQHCDGKGFMELYDAQHAFFVAGMFHLFARLGADMELANFYHIVNAMGIFIHRRCRVEETCLADVFRLYRPAFPGEFLPLTLQSPSLGSSTAIDALALKKGNATWLFLANRSPNESAEVILEGISINRCECTALVAEHPLGTFQQKEILIKENSVELPLLSIGRLHFENQ
jgi:alpha-N-arabinofuranosidase